MGENEVVLLKWAKALLEKKAQQSFNLEGYEVLVGDGMVDVVVGDQDVVTIDPEGHTVKYHPQMEKSGDLRGLIRKSLRELMPPVYTSVEDEIFSRGLELISPMPFRKDVDNYKVQVRSEVIEILKAGTAFATVYPTLKVCRLHNTFATLEQVRDVLAAAQ